MVKFLWTAQGTYIKIEKTIEVKICFGVKIMAGQLIFDLHGCDCEIIDNLEKIKDVAHGAIEAIGAEIVEECSHRFLPIGITYIAVITTSHFSIHTWPEYGYAAVDIFSCDARVPEDICNYLKTALKATEVEIRQFERRLEPGEVQ